MLKMFADSEFKNFLGDNEDAVFRKVFAIEGEVFRNIKNRKTMRFSFGDGHCFIKIHRGVGWREIIKNWTSLKKPVLGASNEFLAIRHLEKLSLHTMKCRAFAERGCNMAKRESFIITDELAEMTTLEDFVKNWKENPPSRKLKKNLIERLAETCAKMHFSGLNHRDCYICHFLIENKSLSNDSIPCLYVLDLHRAEIRKKIPRRLQVKDVAGIWFSSMDVPLSKIDQLRFIAKYSSYGKLDSSFWQSVDKTARKLYEKEWKRNAPASVF